MADLEGLVEQLGKLTVLEAVQLTRLMEKVWGIQAHILAPGYTTMPGMPSPMPVEEPTEFAVFLTDIGPRKIDVIKTVRQFVSMGLKEAKELVETPNAAIINTAPKDIAEAKANQLRSVGATVKVL